MNTYLIINFNVRDKDFINNIINLKYLQNYEFKNELKYHLDNIIFIKI